MNIMFCGNCGLHFVEENEGAVAWHRQCPRCNNEGAQVPDPIIMPPTGDNNDPQADGK